MNNPKKKIAVIGLKGLPAFGGAATVGENIIEQLKEKYEFTVYATSSHTNLKTGYYNGYKQVVFKKLPFKKINSFYYYLISAFHALLFGKYYLIHIHHRDAAFIIPLLKIKYKVILTLHGFGTKDLSDKWNKFKWYFEIQEKYFVKKANVVTTVSMHNKEFIENRLQKKIAYISNGININETIIADNKSDYILFAAGRIVSFKRCDVLLKALQKIGYKHKVLIVGDMDQSPEYKNYLYNLSQGLNAEFIGLIKDKEKLMNIYAKAKYVVFPSAIEAMSMVLLEVASLKTPLICSDIPGNTHVFNQDEVLFFKTDDLDDLAQKILWAETNTIEMEFKAKNAYNKLVKEYQWNNVAIKYKQLFDTTIVK